MAEVSGAKGLSFINDTNHFVFQSELPNAIKISSKYPANNPNKGSRLEFVEHLILSGADPMKEMDLQGEMATPMQRALEYGDPHTIRVIREAMERFSKMPPLLICKDPDAIYDEDVVERLPIAIIFPGQGSQYVKMLSEVKDLEPCRKLIDKATEILGYDILDLCLNGPESKLEETKFCQPAIFLANMCALEKLRLEKPEVVEKCKAVAGLSLGEMSACCAAGMFSFDDGLKLVRARADNMDQQAKTSDQCMLSVAGLAFETVETLCAQAKKQVGGGDEVCQVANHLFPKGYSCAGTRKAIEKLKTLCEKEGALQCKILKTSGAFHTSIMKPAADRFYNTLKAYLVTMSFPKMDVYMNCKGESQRAGTDPREMNWDLTAQIHSPVLWSQCCDAMIRDGITEFYECGPMKQLKAMMKRINQDAWKNTHSVEV